MRRASPRATGLYHVEVNGYLAFLLLLIAGALLMLAAAGLRRRSGRAESDRESEAKVALFGLAIGFLGYFLFGSVLVLLPLAMAFVVLLGSKSRPALRDVGTFLISSAGLWVVFLGERRWNDLADPAVSEPLWSPYPLAFAGALLVLGIVLRIGAGTLREPSS